MAKSALTVLAECVDTRSGTRFQPGDTFDPAPTVDQATRLVAARCLPDGAVDVAQKAQDAEAKKPAPAKAEPDAEADQADA